MRLRWVLALGPQFFFFRYQHVGIGNAKSLRLGGGGGVRPARDPNASGFALQWNIGLKD